MIAALAQFFGLWLAFFLTIFGIAAILERGAGQ